MGLRLTDFETLEMLNVRSGSEAVISLILQNKATASLHRGKKVHKVILNAAPIFFFSDQGTEAFDFFLVAH